MLPIPCDSKNQPVLDVDECAVNNGGCEQKCLNSIGSFICLCEPNFRLAADGYSCVRSE